MKTIWIFIGRTVFWLGWPILFASNLFSKRTRVLVVCGEDVLLVRGWISDGEWNLPGGGLHSKEEPAEGAVRELKEETGIEVKATELQKIYSGMTSYEKGLKFFAHAYVIEFSKKPPTKKQKIELLDLEWKNWQQVQNDPKTSKNLKKILNIWQSGKINN